MEVFQRELRRVLGWGRLRRALRAGVGGVLVAAVANALLRFLSRDPLPGLYGIGGLGFLAGLSLPLKPEPFLLWAGRRLGVGEALLAARELVRRGEMVLLGRLVAATGLRGLRPGRLLIPGAADIAAAAGIVALVLVFQLLPPPRWAPPVTPPAAGAERAAEAVVDRAGPTGGARALVPDAVEPPGDAGRGTPEGLPTGRPGGVPTAEAAPPSAPAEATAPPGATAEGEGGAPPTGSPSIDRAGAEEGLEERASPGTPLAEGASPADISPGPAGRPAGTGDGTGDEGRAGAGTVIAAPRPVPGPPTGGTAPAPRPSDGVGEEPSPEGTAELAGEVPGEAPTPGEEAELWRIAPPRVAEVSTRTGEGPVRSSAVISPPPEPPGDAATPRVPPVGGAEISLSGRDLPPGAEALVKRYFLFLTEEGG